MKGKLILYGGIKTFSLLIIGMHCIHYKLTGNFSLLLYHPNIFKNKDACVWKNYWLNLPI